MKENSIEKDEKILNNMKIYMQENIEKGFHKFIYNDLGNDEKCIDVINAIEHILSDYKRVLKENEYIRNELDKQQTTINKYAKENEKLKNKLLDTLEGQKVIKEETPQYIKENYIPVQIIKDKIEKEIKYHERNILEIENITMLKSKTAKEEAKIEFNKYAIVVLKKILQELIEGEN